MKGYEPGNIQWEEHKFNSVKRRGTKWQGCREKVVPLKQVKFKKGTPEHREHQRYASHKRWNKS